MPVNPKSLENLKKRKLFGIDQPPGNKGGRSILEKIVRDQLENKDCEELKETVKALIKMVKEGGKGASAAASVLYERGYGRVRQDIDVTSGGNTVIQFVAPFDATQLNPNESGDESSTS